MKEEVIAHIVRIEDGDMVKYRVVIGESGLPEMEFPYLYMVLQGFCKRILDDFYKNMGESNL